MLAHLLSHESDPRLLTLPLATPIQMPKMAKVQYLQMTGDDRFNQVTAKEWKSGKAIIVGSKPDKRTMAEASIFSALGIGAIIPRQDLLSVLRKAGIGREISDEVINALVESGKIERLDTARGAASFRLSTEKKTE